MNGDSKTDAIKSIVRDAIAGVALLGSLMAVFVLIKDGVVSGDAGLAVFVGVVGLTSANLFNARSADQAQKAYQAGVNTTPAEGK